MALLGLVVAGNLSIDIHLGAEREGVANGTSDTATSTFSQAADQSGGGGGAASSSTSVLSTGGDAAAPGPTEADEPVPAGGDAPTPAPEEPTPGAEAAPAAPTGSGDPAPAAAEATDPCAGAELRAVDHGVDEESITVALLTVNLAALEAMGFGISTGEVDDQKILDAWANHLNGNGGVACREVQFVHVETDLDVDRQIADCKRLTQDMKVHAVLSPGGLVAGAQCITKDNDTPLVTSLAAPDYWGEEGHPYLWDLLMSQDRILKNHVQWLAESGAAVPGRDHIGVVYASEPYSGPSVKGSMVPEFEQLGYQVTEAEVAFDPEQAAAQMAGVVVEFQQKGVDHVVLPTSIVNKTQFMQQAEQQMYFPDYSDDEATVGCQDFITDTYPERSWDRAHCVSTGLLNGAPNGLRPDELQEYFATNPFAQKADRIYSETNPEGYDNDGESSEEDTLTQQGSNYLYGSLISLWAQAAHRVGPELTRANWGAAMSETGTFDQTVSPHQYTYAPGKWSGPDNIQIVQWFAEAGNGYDERLWRKKTGFFPSYY